MPFRLFLVACVWWLSVLYILAHLGTVTNIHHFSCPKECVALSHCGLFPFISSWMCVFACVWAHVCACVWRPGVDVLRQDFLLDSQSSLTQLVASQLALRISFPPPKCWDYRQATTPTQLLHVGFDPNSNPQACLPSVYLLSHFPGFSLHLSA